MAKLFFDKTIINVLSLFLGLKTRYSPRIYDDNSIVHMLYVTNDFNNKYKVGSYGFWITENSLGKMYKTARERLSKIAIKTFSVAFKNIFS